MIGSPIDSGTWNGVEAAYYTGYGSGEFIWLVVSVVMCVVAIIAGHSHESKAYKNAESRNSD